MRRVAMVLAAGLLVLFFAAMVVGQPAPDQAQPAKIRIGTYDNRAIAVAFAASSLNTAVKEKMAAYEAAKAANDTAKMKELEAWGQRHQRSLHFQGFGHVPVGDLLQPVQEKIASVAQARHLAAIVMECDFTAADVETVDVTDDLVALYEPSAKTLDNVRKVRAVLPIALVDLAELPADQ